MIKQGVVDRILVGIFSAGIAWFIIAGPYYRKGVKAVLLISLISLVIIGLREKKFTISAFFSQYIASRYGALIFFSISVLVSMILSKDFRHSAQIFLERYFLYFLVFEMGRRIFTSKTVARILNESFGVNIFGFMKYVFISAALLLGAGGVADYIRFRPDRLFSAFGNDYFMLPMVIIYYLPVVYCLMFQGNSRWQRVLAILALAMLSSCMVFTGTRAAWLAAPIGIFFVSFSIHKKSMKYFVFSLAILCCLIYFFKPDRMSDLRSCIERKDVMLAAIGIFRENIFFGAGPGMYEKLVHHYSKGFVSLHAHSTYLEILAEFGIVGLTAFLAVFVNFYLSVFKNRSIHKVSSGTFLYTGLLASNVACLIFAHFSTNIMAGFHGTVMFWLIFGMCFGLHNAQRGNGTIELLDG